MRLLKMTINVFIDTQVFDSQQLEFDNAALQKLIALKEVGAIRIFSTEITRREIEKHVNQKGREAFQAFEKFRKSQIAKHLTLQFPVSTADQVQSLFLAAFQSYWDRLGVTELPIADGAIRRVVEKYFAVAAPFGTGKKAEFPDAIAADAILAWCEKNDEKMHIVSGDPDWKAICEQNESRLRINERLPEFLSELFPEPEVAKAISDALRSDENQLIEFLGGELIAALDEFLAPDFDIDMANYPTGKFGDIFILDAENGSASVQADVLFDFEGTFTAKSWRPGSKLNSFKRGGHRATVAIYLQYDENDPFDIEVELMDMVVVGPLDPKDFRVNEPLA